MADTGCVQQEVEQRPHDDQRTAHEERQVHVTRGVNDGACKVKSFISETPVGVGYMKEHQ